MRSMVEVLRNLKRPPPPHFVRSPSPAKAGEDFAPYSFRPSATP
jgi:hypothetical protein